MASPVEFKVSAGHRIELAVRGHVVADPRATVVLVPGFAEYTGRYDRLAQELGARGYSTYAYDPRGQGASSGHRGHTPAWSAVVDDLGYVLGALESENLLRGRRALVGVSMGGLTALDWTLAHQAEGRIHGLVLIAPFLEMQLKPPVWKVLLATTVGAVIPTFSEPHGLKGSDMTSDPLQAAAYDQDPRLVRTMSARVYHEFHAAQRRLASVAAAAGIALPVLVMQGTADPIARAVTTERWARQVPVPWCDYRSYTGFRHELLNELKREEVVRDLLQWLDRRVLQVLTPAP
jgi:alpha-beta hydrolase superfamily lysophospholipase